MFGLGEKRIKVIVRDLVLELIYWKRFNDEDRAREPAQKEVEGHVISRLVRILQRDVQLGQVDDLAQHRLHERDRVRVNVLRVGELFEVLQAPRVAV